MSSVSVSWKPEHILLSYGLSVLGCLVGVYLSEQFRLRCSEGSGILRPNHILMLMALSIGGVGVWAMHFIGMQAIILKETITGIEHTNKYDIFMTAISLIAVVLCSYIGLYISTRDRVFMKNSLDIADMLLADGKRLSFQEAKRKFTFHKLALFKGLHSLLQGGIVIGGGISIMHYVGMKAQVGDIEMKWQIGVIISSVIIAIVVATVALWIMFRLLSLYPRYEILRIASACIMGIAACGMHYTGMYGAKYMSQINISKSISIVIDAHTAGVIGLTFGLLISCFCTMLIIADLRSSFHHSQNLLNKYEKVIIEMDLAQSSILTPFIARFRTLKDSCLDSTCNNRNSFKYRNNSGSRSGLRKSGTRGSSMLSLFTLNKLTNVRIYHVTEKPLTDINALRNNNNNSDDNLHNNNNNLHNNNENNNVNSLENSPASTITNNNNNNNNNHNTNNHYV